jgi:uncharacterized membrane protein YfhO
MWQHVSALLTSHHQAIHKFRPYEHEVLLLILIVIPNIFYIPVQDNQQMPKGVFIILIKLPQHVSAVNCHLQGVTRSCKLLQFCV